MNNQVKLLNQILEAMLAQAIADIPRECCGLLGGRNSLVSSHYPLTNKSSEPEIKYFAAPEDLFQAMRSMREAGEELIGIYHSHPRGQAYPSPTDIELAFYPHVVYLIIGLEPHAETRAFRIDGTNVEEVKIELDDHVAPLRNERESTEDTEKTEHTETD